MEPVTIIIISLLAGSGLLAGVWPWIVDFFSTKIAPWVRERISPALGDALAEFMVFADKGITPLRRGLKSLLQMFRQHVLGSKMEVQKLSASTAKSKTTTIVRAEDGKLVQSTTEEVLEWDDLPPEIRSEMTRQGSQAAQMDLKKAAEERFREQAQKVGMAMELTA